MRSALSLRMSQNLALTGLVQSWVLRRELPFGTDNFADLRRSHG
jgi:hypothetical protein